MFYNNHECLLKKYFNSDDDDILYPISEYKLDDDLVVQLIDIHCKKATSLVRNCQTISILKSSWFNLLGLYDAINTSVEYLNKKIDQIKKRIGVFAWFVNSDEEIQTLRDNIVSSPNYNRESLILNELVSILSL